MGLFRRNYVEKIKDLVNRLDEVSLTEDDLILKFREKVTEIEEYDVECIRLIKKLSQEGHLSEKLKRALLNQLLFLLRRVERLKFENKEKLREMKDEIEAILKVELTVERIGVEVNRIAYHGGAVSGVKSLQTEVGDQFRLADVTLGQGIYCTDNHEMAINYAFFRYYQWADQPHIIKRFGRNLMPSVYSVKFKKGKNHFADLSDERKISSLFYNNELYKSCFREADATQDEQSRNAFLSLAHDMAVVVQNKLPTKNIRHLITSPNSMMAIVKFLKDLGYHGLRSKESGEFVGESFRPPFVWVTSLSYIVFDPNDIEIIEEEHFTLKNGKAIKI